MHINKPRNPGCRLAFLALVMLALFLSAAHADDKTVAKAKECRAAGMTAFNQGRWQPAVKNFKASYELYAHATTAYMVCCAYLPGAPRYLRSSPCRSTHRIDDKTSG